MKRFNSINILIAFSLFVFSQQSVAEISFNGFASIKAAMLFDDEKDLNGNGIVEESESAFSGRYDDNIDFKKDSLIALQTNANLGDGLSATLQLVALGEDNFEIEANWAYITYELNEDWNVLVGRFALPSFYKSEYGNIGYTHNYSRLPYSVYTDLTFNVVDGIRFDNVSHLDDIVINSSISFSQWDDKILLRSTGQFYPGEVNDIISGSVEINKDWLTLFFGGFVAKGDFETIDQAVIDPLVDVTLTPLVQAGLLTEQDLANTKNSLSFSGDLEYYYYGFDIDYDDWLLTAEYTDYGVKDSGDSFNEAWYITTGRRIDNWVVTYTRGSLKQPIDKSQVTSLPLLVQPFAMHVRAELAEQTFTTDTISIRYDFHPHAAYKLDLFMWDPLNSDETISGFSSGIDVIF